MEEEDDLTKIRRRRRGWTLSLSSGNGRRRVKKRN